MMGELSGYFLDRIAPELHQRLVSWLGLRLVFFAGLPGTGKSLLVQQLAHLAAPTRRVHLLQWDVARLPFEACEAGRAYPQVDGATHPLIRRAVGLWAREAVDRWAAGHDEGDILIGETPLVGNRLIELTLPLADAVEPLLASAACRFVVPAPSPAVRSHIEAERALGMASPRNAREREDAPVSVLRDAWQEIATAGRGLGLAVAEGYDPGIYAAVCGRLLQHRQVEVVALDSVLPAGAASVYDFLVACEYLTPTPDEAEAFVRAAAAAGDASGRISFG